MDYDMVEREPVPSFWRAVAGGAFGLAFVVIWAWKGLVWALIAVIAVLVAAAIARYNTYP